MFERGGLTIEFTEQIVKRHNFFRWAKRMNNSDDTLQRLIQLMENASGAAVEWLQPLPGVNEFGNPESSFVNHHVIIAGRKE